MSFNLDEMVAEANRRIKAEIDCVAGYHGYLMRAAFCDARTRQDIAWQRAARQLRFERMLRNEPEKARAGWDCRSSVLPVVPLTEWVHVRPWHEVKETPQDGLYARAVERAACSSLPS